MRIPAIRVQAVKLGPPALAGRRESGWIPVDAGFIMPPSDGLGAGSTRTRAASLEGVARANSWDEWQS